MSALGTLGSAVAALILVGFTYVQLRKLTQQVDLAADQADSAERGVEAATKAANAAQEAVRESARVRADDAAPRLVVLFDAALPGARVMVKRPVGHDNPAAHYRSLLHPWSPTGFAWQDSDIETGEPFVLVDHERDVAWYEVQGVVTNEGAGSARIRLDGDADFVKGERLLSPGGGWAMSLEMPPQVGASRNREYLLAPGGSAAFTWAIAHPLSDWAHAAEHPHPPNYRGAAFMTLVAMNSAANVVDHIDMEASARVLQKCDSVRWMLLSPQSIEWGTTVHPTKRSYLNEGPASFAPPEWSKTYKSDAHD